MQHQILAKYPQCLREAGFLDIRPLRARFMPCQRESLQMEAFYSLSTKPYFSGKSGSFSIIESSRQAEPLGVFRPHSQASTVFFDTPKTAANAICVKLTEIRMSLTSLLEKDLTGSILLITMPLAAFRTHKLCRSEGQFCHSRIRKCGFYRAERD